ncbi:MAG TPA: putative glycolipid-binding domain-containing protein [Alphaproteobacteria bacterium]|nr:putative glycolipid-binding domain-containing protein [Alphaproteobacteria bacterium]
MIRSVFWRPLDEIGLEHLLLEGDNDGFHADGAILQTKAGQPFRVRYRIEATPGWKMRACDIVVEAPRRLLLLRIDAGGRWRDEARGENLPGLADCREVDIQVSPFTNSLAIGRLALSPGQSRDIEAAYITVPELTLAPASQRYTCLAPDRYRYEGLDTGFSVELPIDADGLVLDYPGLFRRVVGPND